MEESVRKQKAIGEILNELRPLGFKGKDLEKSIHEAASFDGIDFHVNCQRAYGNDSMYFRWLIGYDYKSERFIPKGFHATLLPEIIIPDSVINGIQVAKLEGQIKQFNWEMYYSKANAGSFDNGIRRAGDEILRDLNNLPAHHNFEGRVIQELLLLKYLSPFKHQDTDLSGVRESLERKQYYSMSGPVIVNANLAYHLLSGQFAELANELRSYGINPEPQLKEKLSRTPGDELTYIYRQHNANGLFEVSFAIQKAENGRLSIVGITGGIRRYPQISHGVFNGIDSRVLDPEFAKYDWHNNESLTWYDKQKGCFIPVPEVEKLLDKLKLMSDDDAGKITAKQLMKKYFWQVPYYKKYLYSSKPVLSTPLIEFPAGMDLHRMYNLLSGRAVMMEPEGQNVLGHHWTKLDFVSGTILHFDGFYHGSLWKSLISLPMLPVNCYTLTNQLCRGDLVTINLSIENQQYNGYHIEASPSKRGFNLYDEKMNPVYKIADYDLLNPIMIHQPIAEIPYQSKIISPQQVRRNKTSF